MRNCFLIFSLLVFLGCSTIYNPATERNEFIVIPTSSEVVMGQDIHQQILSKYKLSKDPALGQKVQRIGQRVAMMSDRKDYSYHFFVIEKDELNAFTVPGGKIYIFTGLMDQLTDPQVAAVLAHEIGHCAARHTIKKFQAALGYNIIGGIVLSQLGEKAQSIAALGADTVMNLVFSSYGRQDEYQADQLGVKYLYLSGYDPNAMLETLEVLRKGSKGPNPPEILASHPYLENRIERARQEIQQVDAKYGQSKKGF
jgi:predicted Zn-dependent protease